MKENGFTLKKARSRRYPVQTITNVDYAGDIVLLANAPPQAESLLYSLGQAAGGIGLYVNVDKTEYLCFNQKGKIVDKFPYLRSSILSTENDITM